VSGIEIGLQRLRQRIFDPGPLRSRRGVAVHNWSGWRDSTHDPLTPSPILPRWMLLFLADAGPRRLSGRGKATLVFMTESILD
jgi:hypothetical protein